MHEVCRAAPSRVLAFSKPQASTYSVFHVPMLVAARLPAAKAPRLSNEQLG